MSCFFDFSQVHEEVDIVTKGGNYGWRVYEGFIPFQPKKSSGGTTCASSIKDLLHQPPSPAATSVDD